MTKTETPAVAPAVADPFDALAYVDVPVTVKRKAEPIPNPFLVRELFPTPEGKVLALSVPYVTEGDQKAAKRLKSQARKAAETLGLGARIREVSNENGTHLDLRIWTAPKRAKKDDTATPAA